MAPHSAEVQIWALIVRTQPRKVKRIVTQMSSWLEPTVEWVDCQAYPARPGRDQAHWRGRFSCESPGEALWKILTVMAPLAHSGPGLSNPDVLSSGGFSVDGYWTGRFRLPLVEFVQLQLRVRPPGWTPAAGEADDH